jgi:hypothetical protein
VVVIKKYYPVGTIPKSNIKITERDKIDTPIHTTIYISLISHFGVPEG